jgi:hypothetical protein
VTGENSFVGTVVRCSFGGGSSEVVVEVSTPQAPRVRVVHDSREIFRLGDPVVLSVRASDCHVLPPQLTGDVDGDDPTTARHG